MQILAFSDLHRDRAAAARLAEIAADADLVIGAGDFATMRRGIADALEPLGAIAAPLILVPGNAESAEECADAARDLTPRASVLHGGGAEVAGVKIFGLGYAVPTTPFGDWSCDLTEDQAAEMLADLDAVDILVSHSPPQGAADKNSANRYLGSTAVADAIRRARPRLVVCGHVHASWGVVAPLGDSVIVNAGPRGQWIDLAPGNDVRVANV